MLSSMQGAQCFIYITMLRCLREIQSVCSEYSSPYVTALTKSEHNSKSENTRTKITTAKQKHDSKSGNKTIWFPKKKKKQQIRKRNSQIRNVTVNLKTWQQIQKHNSERQQQSQKFEQFWKAWQQIRQHSSKFGKTWEQKQKHINVHSNRKG